MFTKPPPPHGLTTEKRKPNADPRRSLTQRAICARVRWLYSHGRLVQRPFLGAGQERESRTQATTRSCRQGPTRTRWGSRSHRNHRERRQRRCLCCHHDRDRGRNRPAHRRRQHRRCRQTLRTNVFSITHAVQIEIRRAAGRILLEDATALIRSHRRHNTSAKLSHTRNKRRTQLKSGIDVDRIGSCLDSNFALYCYRRGGFYSHGHACGQR